MQVPNSIWPHLLTTCLQHKMSSCMYNNFKVPLGTLHLVSLVVQSCLQHVGHSLIDARMVLQQLPICLSGPPYHCRPSHSLKHQHTTDIRDSLGGVQRW